MLRSSARPVTEKRNSYSALDLGEVNSASATSHSAASVTHHHHPPPSPPPYESDQSILPTHSPSTRYTPTMGSPQRHSSSATSSSASRRFAAGFDPYPQNPTESEHAAFLGTGHSASHFQDAQLGAGYRDPKLNKYAAMIPVHKPPSSPFDTLAWLCEQEEFVGLVYFLLSLATRLYRIGKSNVVVWDEAHFGKFGSHYLKQEFYFDVHPPLGKMLVGLAGLLSGYRGHFEFKSGETYPDDVNYVGMRIFLAMFGVVMVPLAWFTSGALDWNWRARHLLAIIALCENGWLVISRFILLDSMLLCFTFTTVLGLVKLIECKHMSFSPPWWFWLTWTGASIGCVSSVKWVGLFVTALVGVFTIEDLWHKFGDLRLPVRAYVRHWCARILCLIVLPISIYMLSFKLHFLILNHSGPGDAQMSSLFQSHLRGNDFAKAPLEVAFGSKVTVKNMGFGGGLLHSHVQTYPTGSQQQQVTCYHYRDTNNDFTITPAWDQPQLETNLTDTQQPVRMLKAGDTLRLVHQQTGRSIHSHSVPAPVSKDKWEVSAYGNSTIGDSNDHWVVEVVEDIKHGKVAPGGPIRSLTTKMRFRHLNSGCYLHAGNTLLPQWGWKQVEVSCDKKNHAKDEHTWWNVENHWNSRLPEGNNELYSSPFLRDFIHLNVAMMTSNNALIPDTDKEDILASKPLDWPFLHNGLRMNSWADNSIKFYLIGNPIVWWASSASLSVFVLTWLWYMMRQQRRIHDLSPIDWNHFLYVGKLAGFGWLLHFGPMMSLGRVCYLHHHLPILYFQVIMLVHMLDHFFWRSTTAVYHRSWGQVMSGSVTSSVAKTAAANVRRPVSESFKNLVFIVSTCLVVVVFWWFKDNSYGFEGDIHKHKSLQWRKSWNIY